MRMTMKDERIRRLRKIMAQQDKSTCSAQKYIDNRTGCIQRRKLHVSGKKKHVTCKFHSGSVFPCLSLYQLEKG